MKKNVPIYKKIANLIRLSCELQNVLMPYVYFIRQNYNDFTMRDIDYQFISSDIRDMGTSLHYVKYLSDQNVLYISEEIFSNPTLAYALVLRQTRTIYQFDQMKRYRCHSKTNERDSIIRQWIYSYSNSKESGFRKDSPSEVDKDAYSNYLMRCLFETGYKYDFLDPDQYRTRYEEIQQKYSTEHIGTLRKYL